MRLIYSPASPFARKVRLVAAVRGVPLDILQQSPFEDPAELLAVNPLGKVPALILNDGTALYDSPVICEHLESLGSGPATVPTPGAERMAALRLQALADGVMDAAVSTALENRRPEGERSPSWIGRWRRAIERSLAAAEDEAPGWGDRWQIGQIAMACALAYLDLRFPDFDWRAGQPRLAEWLAAQADRPGFRETAPA